MPCWDVDATSKAIWPVEEANGTVGLSEIVGIGSTSTNNPSGVTAPVTGPGGSYARSFTNTGGGWSVTVGSANLLSKATSTQWTLDVMMIQTTAIAAFMRFDFRNGSGQSIFGVYPNTNGTLEVYMETSSRTAGAGFDGYSPVFFPKTGWQHIRAIIDYTAGTVGLYTAPMGTVPTLFYTLTIDTNDLRSPISTMQIGNGSLEGLGRIRVSTGVRTDAFPMIGTPANLPTLTSSVSGSNLIITASRNILNTATAANPASYTITQPAGSTPVTVTTATVGTNSVTLALSGDQLQGGSYSVTVPVNTIRAADTGEGNSAATLTFTGATSLTPAILTAIPTSATTIAVTFNKAVRQVSSANTDDALRIANYIITGGLSVTGVASTGTNSVLLTHTPSETPGTSYTVTVSNIKDLAGNSV